MPVPKSAKPFPVVRQRGFTLIELAIVVAIVGVMISGGVFGLNALRENARQKESNTSLRDVEYALTLHVIRHGRLPWADTDQDGDEDANATEGTVPWTALDLSRGDVIDGWGNFLRYAVDPQFVNVAAAELTCARDPGALRDNFQQTGALALQDLAGGATPAAYVLISHGANGLGAVNAGGGANAGAASGNETENTDADVTFRAEGLAAGGVFDDIAAGRGAGQILRDTGCRQVSELPPLEEDECVANPALPQCDGGGEEPEQSTGDGPGLSGQIDFSRKGMTMISEWDGAFESFTATNNNSQRGYLPEVNAATGEVSFNITRNLSNGEQNQDFRSCLWSQQALRLKNATVRAYFETSFELDGNGNRGHGLVFAMLPWELPTRRDGYFGIDRCGQEGDYLGFASQNHSNSGMRNLYTSSEFTGSPSYDQVMPLGVELDVSRSRGNITGRAFFDPKASSTADQNHVAIVFDDVYHDADGGNNSHPNPACPDAGSDACYLSQGSSAGERMWLEASSSSWHKVRVEVEDGPVGDCTSGQARVKAWVWPAGASCAGDCEELKFNYTVPDGAAHIVQHCVAKPTRAVSMGHGWTPQSWDSLRVGFTVGQPGRDANQAKPRIRNFIAGSTTKWPIRSEAAADPTALSAEVFNDHFGTSGVSSLNWTILNKAGAKGSNGHTAVSWLSAPDKGADILSYRGEIVVTPSTGRWQQGFGVRGAGGTTSEWDIPPLDNIVDASQRQGPGTEEALSFHYDALYKKARILLGGLGAGEKARIIAYQAGKYENRQAYEVSGCDAGYGAQLVLDPVPVLFDSLYFEPLPKANNDISSFYVRSVRACGADVATASCSLSTALPPADTGWMTTCTPTVTKVSDP